MKRVDVISVNLLHLKIQVSTLYYITNLNFVFHVLLYFKLKY